ncbi:LysM peptidoglycan-binding domain-containing protein [Archangium sp.]|uniref:LysM peptidoglycan-binding domain-containing protein n=1 Tax=Archangium sp. TaxID=1872627 RepID=UPI00286A6666|nr:LysM peptidoglycan-binding domain-containing protein [Archangium sp.]
MSGIHKVRSGETLAKIAERYHTTVHTLATLNQIRDVNLINVGQMLKLPGAGGSGGGSGSGSSAVSHKVRSGDTLGEIGQRFGVTVYAIAQANGLRDADAIFVGQMLRIPGGVDSKGGSNAQGSGGGATQPRQQSGGSNSSSSSTTPKTEVKNQVTQVKSEELGILSRTYESKGEPGTVSSGVGDAGGVSYGTYQLATETGTAKEFVGFLKGKYPTYHSALSGKTPGSSAFSEAWKKLAAKDPKGFFNVQHDFIKATHYDPIVAEIKSTTGLDVTTRSKTLQDVAWSTAVQHRHASDNIFSKALAGRDPKTLSDEVLIKAVYAERGRRNTKNQLVYFTNNPQKTQESVAKRFVAEQKDALAALAKEKAGGKSGGSKSASSGQTSANSGSTSGSKSTAGSTKPAGGTTSTTSTVTQVSGTKPTQVQARHVEVPFFSQFKNYYDASKKLRFSPGDTSCFKAAVAMAQAVGVTVLGSDSRIQVATSENGKGQVQVNAKKAAEAIRYIDSELDAGRPVVVGVSHKDADYNADEITDHFVTITGRTVDEKGRVCYPFHDPGTSHDKLGMDTQPTNRFYVDANGNLIRPGKLGHGYTYERRFEVAMVRLNKGTKVIPVQEVKQQQVKQDVKQQVKDVKQASQQNGSQSTQTSGALPASGIPDTRNLTEAKKYDLYVSYLTARAKKFDAIPEHVTVLGLRHQTNTRANNKKGLYDDRIVVLWTTVAGDKKVLEFEANTEPSGKYEYKEGGDADSDGNKDLGRLPEGTYTYSSRVEAHSKLGKVFRTTQADIKLERDSNHDGHFTSADKVKNTGALSSWQSVLFHRGGQNSTGSAGCQTMRPEVYEKFLKAISAAPQKTFQYTIINVSGVSAAVA